jgi:hypothetical protein
LKENVYVGVPPEAVMFTEPLADEQVDAAVAALADKTVGCVMVPLDNDVHPFASVTVTL